MITGLVCITPGAGNFDFHRRVMFALDPITMHVFSLLRFLLDLELELSI
jgi:hypothetical protein